MSYELYQVDAFTDRAFAGNPAAVCLLDVSRDENWMQNVAREMNLSETAFVVAKQGGGFGLRWFTPEIEVELCGHATLANAHVLWETGRLGPDEPTGGRAWARATCGPGRHPPAAAPSGCGWKASGFASSARPLPCSKAGS